MADEFGDSSARVKGPPRLIAGLMRRIAKWFGPKPGETKERGRHGQSHGTLPGDFPWEISDGRKEQFEDIQAMDADDGVIARCLDLIAERATIGEGAQHAYWFTVKPSTPAREGDDEDDGGSESERNEAAESAAGILNEMLLRTGLNDAQRCWDDTRAVTKFGNWFWELTFGLGREPGRVRLYDTGPEDQGKTGYVSRVKAFPYPYQVRCNVDAIAEKRTGRPGKCKPGAAAWEQYDDAGNLIAQWDAYEIVHCVHGNRQGNVYAIPMLDSLRRIWRRLRMKEDSMATARITRAYPRLKHRILVPKGATADEVQRAFDLYQENITSRQQISANDTTNEISTGMHKSPVDVETDFYMVAYYTDDGKLIAGDVDEIGGDAPHLADLTDIYWDMTRMLTRIGVPMKYLNMYLESAKPFVDSDNESVDEAFSRLILRLQTNYQTAVWHICMIELLMQGINPMDVADQLAMDMAPVSLVGSHIKSRILNLRAQTAIIWDKLGFPDELIGTEVLDLTGTAVKKWTKERETRRQRGDEATDEERDEIIERYTQPERTSDPASRSSR